MLSKTDLHGMAATDVEILMCCPGLTSHFLRQTTYSAVAAP